MTNQILESWKKEKIQRTAVCVSTRRYGQTSVLSNIYPQHDCTVSKEQFGYNKTHLKASAYPQVVESNSCAEDVSVQGNQVRLEGVDEEPGLVSVNVHAVLLQELLLLSPAL